MKFSFSYDRLFPSGVEVFTGQKYSVEDNALAEAILKQVKKKEHHSNIYVIDRKILRIISVKNQLKKYGAVQKRWIAPFFSKFQRIPIQELFKYSILRGFVFTF